MKFKIEIDTDETPDVTIHLTCGDKEYAIIRDSQGTWRAQYSMTWVASHEAPPLTVAGIVLNKWKEWQSWCERQ